MNVQQILEKIGESFPDAIRVHETSGKLQFSEGADAEEVVRFVGNTLREPSERYFYRRS